MNSVVIKTFDNYFSARIFLTKLQDRGLNCYLFDENTVTIGPVISTAIGYIKLVVADKDFDFASRLLAEFEHEKLKNTVCPKCFSNNFLEIPKPARKNYLVAFLTWLFSSYAVSVENVYQCQNCGYECDSLPEAGFVYN